MYYLLLYISRNKLKYYIYQRLHVPVKIISSNWLNNDIIVICTSVTMRLKALNIYILLYNIGARKW